MDLCTSRGVDNDRLRRGSADFSADAAPIGKASRRLRAEGGWYQVKQLSNR